MGDGYDWSAAAEGAQSEKLNNGYHWVTVERIVMGKKSGPFKSKAGDPQIMVVFADPVDGGESVQMYTLSEKAGWTLSRLLSKLGVDLARLKADKIVPQHFSNEGLAKSYLLGKSCWVKIEPDGDYQKVTPLDPADVPDAVRVAQDFPPVTDPADPFK